ncbi:MULTISPECIES: type II secretion system minor pseudopilin GspH [Vibrio]|uniref:Type II secretion system protein H n=1 Tax=Vibrio algicola TaxID=2662262 RepID=A0A5Q0TF92_9VIBR|nr:MULTISPECIES: type II secretion system minor pseudopilin GspH [Vibrio]MBD1576011.1 type II secretion system minor pseudopilin GspH [Vibrio sp. S11_S32]
MKRQRGFTLLEILLVVVLMSLSALAVIQTMPERKDDQLKDNALRFFQRLQLLSDDAILNGQDYGIRIDDKKFSFTYMTLTDDGWKVVKGDKHFTATHLPDELGFHFQLGSDAWGNDDRLFKQEDFYEDKFEQQDKDKKEKPPQIFVLSSGENTPFELSFIATDDGGRQNKNDKENQQYWRVKVLETGVVKLFSPGESDTGKSHD